MDMMDRKKAFEQYEEEASYFAYMHQSDDETDNMQNTKNNKEIVDAVLREAISDFQGEVKKGLRELEDFLLDEGLVKYGNTAAVIDEIFGNYEYAYIAENISMTTWLTMTFNSI